MSSEKQDIRRNAKLFRDHLVVSPDWNPDSSAQAARHLMEMLSFPENAVISVYYPIGSEIDPSPIVEKLWQRNLTVCLPCIKEGQRKLIFVPWTPQTQFETRRFGIPEPVDKSVLCTPDILIIPLLAFDQRGYRMGYGQGHYDETLASLRAQKTVLAVGLAYAEQAVLLPLPIENHDERLDMVITPQRVFDFRR
ncbi:MAG: 5-formyltetrahydrofolate cyclo-ligase [Alphaproteobacteria bacterium]|nr:5-formyltetrahydrofolate cyclo-ligase [Alphaproteobacteria bacterium]